MIAADEARRQPQVQAREWAAQERRNPGVAHAGRTLDRITRGLQARADDWDQGTARFVRQTSSIAEAGRRARSQQHRPVIEPGEWDDSDPDMLELPQMTEGRIFRAGYRHASSYR